jgi:ribosomal protein L24E
MKNKIISAYPSFPMTLIAVLVLTLGLAVSGGAQVVRSVETIDAGSEITVRTNEAIETRHANGEVFSATVDNDVIGRSGNVAIPRGSDVELVVREIGNNDLALDLDSVNINGRRYGLAAESNVTANRREGVGVNKRTGKYVGGGAILGAIIGGIAGGGKGAAIGAGAGAAAGAGAQVLTRGDDIDVPAESLLTFRLSQPIQTPALDNGFYRDGRHYHTGYGDDRASAAYQAGLRDGRYDAERNLSRNPRYGRWTTSTQRGDYEAGYNRGYNPDYDQRADYRYKPGGEDRTSAAYSAGVRDGRYDADRNLPRNPRSNRWNTAVERRDYEAGYYRGYNPGYDQSADNRYKPSAGGSITVGRDNNVSWQGPSNARVYVQSDNNPRQLFASGDSGTQLAPWIQNGHVYVFILVDNGGRELARDVLDLRGRR